MRKKIGKGKNKNIIVLLLDTVRASDVYGNVSLPTMQGLSRHATAYTKAVSPGTWTAPSHASLFMDKRVSSIRNVSQNFFKQGTKIEPWFVKTKFLNGNEDTLASKLSRYGYYSALFSNNPFLTSFTNLALGFDKVYDIWLQSNAKYNSKLADRVSFVLKGGVETREHIFAVSNAISRMIPRPFFDKAYLSLRKRLDQSVAKADGTYKLDRGVKDTYYSLKKYLEQGHDYMPNFIFINYIEAHENYPLESDRIIQDKWLYMSGIEELDEYISSKLHAAYLQRIRYLDKGIGNTLALMREHGLLDDAAVVITSDHGQLFGEHGQLYHSMFPYREEVEVPMIGANFKNGKLLRADDNVESPTSLLSLHESILNLASGKEERLNGNMRSQKYVVSEHTGISEGWDHTLLTMLKGRSKSAYMIYKAKKKYNIRATTVYSGRFKLMHYFGRCADELYDIEEDPTESENILHERRSMAVSMLHGSGVA
jgi:arylsulfatase A-like enzyme